MDIGREDALRNDEDAISNSGLWSSTEAFNDIKNVEHKRRRDEVKWHRNPRSVANDDVHSGLGHKNRADDMINNEQQHNNICVKNIVKY